MSEYLRRKAEQLANRPYSIEVYLDETTDGRPVYMAKSPELDGCFGQGVSIEDAERNLREARVEYIYSLLEDNLPVPDPSLTITTSASLTSTLILRNKQSDVANLSNTDKGYARVGKSILLYEGGIKS